jgi:CheY-like chemotaxis protein
LWQDDSAMNRKVMARIISGEQRGRLAVIELLEADDGISAVETLRSEMAAGRTVDFVLMDFVMVTHRQLLLALQLRWR